MAMQRCHPCILLNSSHLSNVPYIYSIGLSGHPIHTRSPGVTFLSEAMNAISSKSEQGIRPIRVPT